MSGIKYSKEIIKDIKNRDLPSNGLTGEEFEKWLCDNRTRRFDYHEGYYAAGNSIPFDDNKSDAWKEGYKDGLNTLYGDDDLDTEDIIGV